MNKAEPLVPKPAKSPELTGVMSCRQAALRSFDFYFQNLLWNERGVRTGNDPEFLHYFRVASKRLRVALSVFGKYFPEHEISRYENELKSLAPVLGKARDTDVYLEFLNDKASEILLPEDLPVFNEYENFFLRRKKLNQKLVLKKIDSEDYKRFKEEFKNFISHASASGHGPAEPPVSRLVDQEIMPKFEKLIAHSRKLNPKTSDSELHKFRKKCRKLRYKVEIFLGITGSHGEELDRMLIEFQRALGSHHDAITAGIKLRSFLKTHKKYSKAGAMKKLRKLQEGRAMKFRRKFFRMFLHSNKFSQERQF